jgi:hypothetical protein
MKRRCALAFALLVAASAGVAFGSGGDPLSGVGTTPALGKPITRPIVVTRKEGSFRPSCGPRAMARRLHGYTRALARIDREALRRYWGGQRFRVFAFDGPGLPRSALSINGYKEGMRFLRRHGGLRLRFDEVAVHGSGGAAYDGIARDSEPSDLLGKVEFSCKKPTIIGGGLVFGPDAVEHDAADCPAPSDPVADNAIVVCTAETGG